jgi:response regulator of citrate/malate metabolism
MSIKRVLIAEDDMALKPLWEEFFSRFKEKIDVQWTVSCEEAIKIMEKAVKDSRDFDLIISDIFLAGSGTGVELLNSAVVNSSHAKKLLISAVERKHILEEYPWAIKDVEVVSKPFNGRLYEPIITSLLGL